MEVSRRASSLREMRLFSLDGRQQLSHEPGVQPGAAHEGGGVGFRGGWAGGEAGMGGGRVGFLQMNRLNTPPPHSPQGFATFDLPQDRLKTQKGLLLGVKYWV